jgi:hypothetical protein
VFDGILNWKAGGSGLFINLRRCGATATCPKIFEANSSNEYWAKASSMAQTDSLGHDLGGVANVRYYLLASLPHGAGNGPGICAQPRNPLRPNADLRALLVAARPVAAELGVSGHWAPFESVTPTLP